jgi:BNR repeat-like domain
LSKVSREALPILSLKEGEMKWTSLMIGILGIFLFAQAGWAQWEPAQRLSWNSGDSQYPIIAVDSLGGLHVVWQDSTPGNNEVYYKRSTDGGASWTTGKRLTWTSTYSHRPVIGVDSSGGLHVFWADDPAGNSEIYCRKSTDGGDTWTASQRLTWTAGYSFVPAMAVDSSHHLHVVWSDGTPGNQEIYHKKSTDGGATWTTGQRITWNAGSSINPKIGADSSGNLYVVWQDNTPGSWEVYYAKSTNRGATWTASQRLTWSSGTSGYPIIGIDSSGRLHVVWQGSVSGNVEAFYRKSTDGGASWTTSRRLSLTSGASVSPVVAVDSSDNLHLVWSDDTPGNAEIYYKKSTDAGATWTANRRLSWTSGYSWEPSLAIDTSGNVHVAWYDNTPGNWEIYYKKGK